MAKKQEIYRITLLATILVILLFYFAYRAFFASPIEVSIDRNVIIRSNFDVIYEHWKEEKLARLREQEDYTEIQADSQLNYVLQLCNWTHQQWERSFPDPYPLSNALDILADIRSGKTGGFCGQYAYVLADVLKSVGFFAVRYVELWGNAGESHFVVEVWSDQYEKWMLIDPDQNLYYELADSGIPANAYEIRASLLGKSPVVAKQANNPSENVTDPLMDAYANFAVSLRSDLLRHPKPLTIQDRFDMFLFYQDDQTDEDLFNHEQFNYRIPYRHITRRKEDLYYDCNRVRIEYTIDRAERNVLLEFFTDGSMPNFKEFIISLDNGKTWQSSSYRCQILGHEKEYDLWVRPVNMYDRPGVITKTHIVFQ